MSDDGSDDNDCHSESVPCRNLQTVLDRATDGADIYVISQTLRVDLVKSHTEYQTVPWFWQFSGECCLLKSNITYTLRSINENLVYLNCSCKLDKSN